MRERRRTERHRCRLRCSVQHGRKQDAALVCDVSLSGLSIQTVLPLSQGDPVRVEILEPMAVPLKALAWNIRRIRKGDEVTNVVGMMLSDVGPEYETLAARIAGALHAGRKPRADGQRASPTPSSVGGAKPGTSDGASGQPKRLATARGLPPLPSPRQPWWKLRVKESGGNRTRVVTLPAASAEEAAAKGLREIGANWELIEVRANA
jgi:hypothetical protein